MILNPTAWVRILSGGQYTIKLRSLHRDYPSRHPFGVVHWVPEQLNIKAVTGACKLIDGCSLELCSATPSVASSGICQRNKVNPIEWLSWWPRVMDKFWLFLRLSNGVCLRQQYSKCGFCCRMTSICWLHSRHYIVGLYISTWRAVQTPFVIFGLVFRCYNNCVRLKLFGNNSGHY